MIDAAALGPALGPLFGGPVTVERVARLGGGASKEAWAADVTVGGEAKALLVRRQAGGRIYSEALDVADEGRVLAAAYDAGVPAPRPYGCVEVAGRPALVMDRLPGEAIGRRIVTSPDLAAARARLPEQLAGALARIHAIAPLPFLPGSAPGAARAIDRLIRELDALDEPHPAIEMGLLWLRRRQPGRTEVVVCHGDLRVGNVLVDRDGLVAVLDWEFAHLGDPAEDLAWPLVRAWRFGADGLRLGGIGEVAPYLDRYNALTGRGVTMEDLFYWEVCGNVKWAVGALTQARRHLRGEERSVELAVLGRLAAEMEYEVLHLIEGA